MRAALRTLPHRLAVASGLTRFRRQLNAATILCFHNVVEDDLENRCGDRSLHLGVSRFSAIVRWLAESYEVVRASEIVARMAAQRSVKGLAALTFDDAYLGVLRNAIPVLRERALPSTLFVVSQYATIPRPYWWDVLASTTNLDVALRERALNKFAGVGAEIEAAMPCVATKLPQDLLPASWEQLRSVPFDLIEFGSHSASHPNLSRISTAGLDDELVASRAAVERELKTPVSSLAVPYGRTSANVRAAAARAGYTACYSTESRRVRPADDLSDIPRVSVPAGINIAALECRAVEIDIRTVLARWSVVQ